MRRLTAEAAMCSRRAAPAMLPASAIAKNKRMVTMSKLCMTPLRLRPVPLVLRGGLGVDSGLPPEVLRKGLQGLRPPILDGLRSFANVYRGKEQSEELSDRPHGKLHLKERHAAFTRKMCRRTRPNQQRLARPNIANRDGGTPVEATGAACQAPSSDR